MGTAKHFPVIETWGVVLAIQNGDRRHPHNHDYMAVDTRGPGTSTQCGLCARRPTNNRS